MLEAALTPVTSPPGTDTNGQLNAALGIRVLSEAAIVAATEARAHTRHDLWGVGNDTSDGGGWHVGITARRAAV